MKRNNTKNVFDRVVVAELEPDDQEASVAERASDEAGADVDQEVSDAGDSAPPAGDVGPESDLDSERSAAVGAEEDLDPEQVEKVAADAQRRFGPGLRRSARIAARATGCLIFVVALGLSGFLGWQLKQRQDTANAAHAALNVARDYAVVLSSIDTNEIDKNFAQVMDGATGDFKNMYSQSSAQLRQLLIDNKAVSHGLVVDAGVKSASPSQVEVLMFIDQSVSNSVVPEPRIDRLRMTMTMQLIDGRWLASNVEIS